MALTSSADLMGSRMGLPAETPRTQLCFWVHLARTALLLGAPGQECLCIAAQRQASSCRSSVYSNRASLPLVKQQPNTYGWLMIFPRRAGLSECVIFTD